MGILQVESTIESIEGTYKRTINDRYLAMSSVSALKEKPQLLITCTSRSKASCTRAAFKKCYQETRFKFSSLSIVIFDNFEQRKSLFKSANKTIRKMCACHVTSLGQTEVFQSENTLNVSQICYIAVQLFSFSICIIIIFFLP